MPKHNKPLQSLRFIAAVMIFLHHWVFYNLDPAYAFINTRVLSYFHTPITFFFILSGWALTTTYYDRMKQKTFKFGRYLKKRLLRLYPLHLLTFLISIYFVWPRITQIPRNVFIANFLMVHGFIPNGDYLISFNPVS